MSELRIGGAREFETRNPMLLPDLAESLGPNHAPTTHKASAVAMIRALERSGLAITDQIHVVDGVRSMTRQSGGNYGEITVPNAHLFSLFTVKHPTITLPDGDLLVGYRNSIAQTMARRACVGVSFPVCTNVSLFGEDLVFSRKNTCGQTDINRIAYEGVQRKVLPMFETIEAQISRLSETTVGRVAKRADMFDLFASKVLPAKYIAALDTTVTQGEQAACDDEGVLLFPEVTANRWNMLGLMHAATRVIQDQATRQQATSSQRISKWFRFGTEVAA